MVAGDLIPLGMSEVTSHAWHGVGDHRYQDISAMSEDDIGVSRAHRRHRGHADRRGDVWDAGVVTRDDRRTCQQSEYVGPSEPESVEWERIDDLFSGVDRDSVYPRTFCIGMERESILAFGAITTVGRF
jgi:hypothetical protein